MTPNEADDFIIESIKKAHEREPFVGGVFNAYEPVIHYELYNAALRRDLWETWQEAPLSKGQTKCDLVFPLANGKRLWLEVKMWWFLFEAYGSPYVMQAKTLRSPLADWKRLDRLESKGERRAVLLIRIWDNEQAKKKADEWFENLSNMMTKIQAPRPRQEKLSPFNYKGEKPHIRAGDIILWSTSTHK